MRILLFYETFTSDWTTPAYHFVRGIATELLARGHDVQLFEPRAGGSHPNDRQLCSEEAPDLADAYAMLTRQRYELHALNLTAMLAGADLVIVHESNDPRLIRQIARHRAVAGHYRLLLHDTNHRSITEPARLAELDLRPFDGVLTAGDAITHLYLERGWARHAWTLPFAADVRVFYPRHHATMPPGTAALNEIVTVTDVPDGDVVWVGNYGDGQRGNALDEFLATPVRRLGARAAVYGAGYPDAVIARLAGAGIEYRGWVDNCEVPDVFAQFKVTVHLPRAPYLTSLPGVPPMRLFEAMACGIPLVSARWQDAGGLATPGEHFLVAEDGDAMTAHLEALLQRPGTRRHLALSGLRAIHGAHSCAHRVDRLLAIIQDIAAQPEPVAERVRLASAM